MFTQEQLDKAPIGTIIGFGNNGLITYTKEGFKHWARKQRSSSGQADFTISSVSTYTLWDLINQSSGGYYLITETLDDFKQRVREVATRLAQQHGWCEIVEQALEELGIPKPKHVWKTGDEILHQDIKELPNGSVLKGKVMGNRYVIANSEIRSVDGKTAFCASGYIIEFIPREK